jgi:hypothetical protein
MALSRSKIASAHRSSLLINRRLLLLGFVLAGIPGGPGEAQQPAPSSDAMLADAVRVLTREKTAAEGYAQVLATVGRTDPRYLRGFLLFTDAKAEFDGLIAELKLDLTTGQDPARSAVFTGALQAAAEKRVAFTSFVKSEVVDKVEGARPGLPDAITAVPQLVKAITDAGDEIEHLQWKSFAELAKR